MKTNALNIVFMGTPQFAVPALKALLQTSHNVVAVYTQAPKPSGRGYTQLRSPIHTLAEQHHIPVYTPTTLNDPEEHARFQALSPDIAVVVAYGMLLPKVFLDTPKWGCINVHGSLLPRWRGAAPIQRAIMAGDNVSGVTLMKMDIGLDTGPVIAMESFDLPHDITSGILFDTFAQLGATTLTKHLNAYIAGDLPPTSQSTKGVTMAQKITKEEALLDFSNPAILLVRKIRGLFPSPGAYLYYKGVRLKIGDAVTAPNHPDVTTLTAGTIVDDLFGIQCGEGVLYPTQLQKPGGKMLDIKTFLNGFSINVGDQVNDSTAI